MLIRGLFFVMCCLMVSLVEAQDSTKANSAGESVELSDGTLLFNFSSLDGVSLENDGLSSADSARIEFLLLRAQLEIDTDNFRKAQKFLNKVLRLDENHGEALRNLGDIHAFQEKYKDAVAYYLKCLPLLDSAAMAYNNLGQTYMRMERCQDALECFTILRNLEDAPENTLMSLAQANGACGNLHAALGNLSDYLHLNPTSLPELRYRAQIYMEIGFFADALADLNLYLTAVDDAKSYYLRGLARIQGGKDLIDACEDFVRSRDLGNYEAERALKKYCK